MKLEEIHFGFDIDSLILESYSLFESYTDFIETMVSFIEHKKESLMKLKQSRVGIDQETKKKLFIIAVADVSLSSEDYFGSVLKSVGANRIDNLPAAELEKDFEKHGTSAINVKNVNDRHIKYKNLIVQRAKTIETMFTEKEFDDIIEIVRKLDQKFKKIRS